MNLQIVIPTKGRMARQATLQNLPASWYDRTHLVVDSDDASLVALYDLRGAKVHVHPPHVKTIAQKRAWIIEEADDGMFGSPKIVMLDDDLRFSVRHPDTGHTKLHQATAEDMEAALTGLENILDSYTHAGWSMRQGNNNCKEDDIVGARMCFVLGYQCHQIMDLVRQSVVGLGRVAVREDMDMTLQLLRAGHQNHVNFLIAADQVSGFGAKGGCSSERTIELSDMEAERLAALHPGLVKVVSKAYDGSPPRKEVVVQWKKAMKEGMSK